jgi:ribosomal protein S18 acetylase RimI-like enzyme
MITKTTKEHRTSLLSVIAKSGQFDENGLAHVSATLDEHFVNPQEEIWLTAIDFEPVGVAYCAPEPVTSGTWNLLMLWIKDGFEGRGFGKKLVFEVENQLRTRNARLLIVETSQLPEFSAARDFYEKYGFKREAEIKNFFDEGDNKIIYTKPTNQS